MQAVTGNLKAYYSPKNIILFLTLKSYIRHSKN